MFGGGVVDICIIRDLDIFRMIFSYLFIENDEVIKMVDVLLKDMVFMNCVMNICYNDVLCYEKVMLKCWFDKEFVDLLVKF